MKEELVPCRRFLALLSLIASGLASVSVASADVLSCPSTDGTVRVWDRERNACGRFSANNPDWRNIGNPPWNNRMDDFGNDDWTRGRSMCLYDGYNYSTAHERHRLRPGYRYRWANKVSSNRWTSDCPT
jgi:hypothetical protein